MSKYIWISVGGGDCEPAVDRDGKIYTIGCPDPLPKEQFVIVGPVSYQPSRPKTPQEQAEFDRWLAAERKAGRKHGYRRF